MERRVFGIMKDRPLFALVGDCLLKRSKTQYGILNFSTFFSFSGEAVKVCSGSN